MVTTRKQECDRLIQTANHAPPRAGVVFESEISLKGFVQLAQLRPSIGNSIDHLEIRLSTQSSPPLAILRRCLALVPNVQDLVLELPPLPSSSNFLNVHLPRLQLFNTNIHHQEVSNFLAINPTIRYLTVGPCSKRKRSTCPLRRSDLANIIDLTSPLSCHSQVNPHKLVRLCVGPIPFAPTSTTIAFRRFGVLFSLTTLVLRFSHDDYDLLQTLFQVCPKIENLKLLELPTQSTRARREWNHHATWRANLSRLSNLEQLVLSTPRAIVDAPGDIDEERRLVLRWVTGVGAPRHPSLYLIGLHYGGDAPHARFFSHWTREGDVWSRMRALTAPLAVDDLP